MKSVYTYKDATWVDLENPTREEIDHIRETFSLSHDAAESLLAPSLRHAAEFMDNQARIVLHVPTFKDADGGDAAYEIDFIIGDNFVITAHYCRVKLLEEYGKHLGHGHQHAGLKDARNTLFYGILRAILDHFDQKLVEADHWIRDIENNMFKGHERETIYELSEASRHLIDFRKITSVWPDIFETLTDKGEEPFGTEFAECADEIIAVFDKLDRKLEMLAEAVRDLRETNYSLLSTKQNELMKLLTIFSVVTAAVTGVVLIWLGYLAVK